MNPREVSHVFVDVDAGVPQAELERIAPGLQAQLREDLGPAWNVPTGMDVVRADGHVTPPAAGEVEIQLHKEAPADEQEALALHDKKSDGTPIIHAFCDLLARYGVSLSAGISHETTESRIDPEGDAEATLPDGRVVAVEVADQVEALTYDKNGVEVSNFNTPSNFGIGGNDAPYDFLGKQPEQFQVMPGGYSQTLGPNGWSQTTAMEATGHRAYVAHLDRLGLSRAARRRKRHAAKHGAL